MSVPAVAVTGLKKYFPRLDLKGLFSLKRRPGLWALKEVSFELRPGETLCLMGPNGSGKTTLIKIIATIIAPTQGRVFIQGNDASLQPLAAKRRMGLITCNESSFYGRLTGWQNLAFFARLHNLDPKQAIPPVSQVLDLEPHLDRRFYTYSAGVRRRFDIARGLLHRPDILLMDEPTVNLDPLKALEVQELLAQFHQQGKTIILVTHRLEEARRLGTRLAVMAQGCFHEIHLRPEENLEDLYRQLVTGDGYGLA